MLRNTYAQPSPFSPSWEASSPCWLQAGAQLHDIGLHVAASPSTCAPCACAVPCRHGMATANGEVFVLGGHPTCSDGLVQCMEDALQSVTAFKTYLGLFLRDTQES